MHLPSFNDLVFVLSLGTVIVSASPIVGRREAQLLGYMHPRECKVFDTKNLFELVKDKLKSDQKKELPFVSSGGLWQMAIPKVLVKERPPTWECYRRSDAYKTMDRPDANWDALRKACPKGTI
ncbi:hypothetical protein HHX47_DHR6000383 [Lentinula edodes]|nr:hypothetical protein HHX47_DHR6000383 [Lentinula edodes]